MRGGTGAATSTGGGEFGTKIGGDFGRVVEEEGEAGFCADDEFREEEVGAVVYVDNGGCMTVVESGMLASGSCEGGGRADIIQDFMVEMKAEHAQLNSTQMKRHTYLTGNKIFHAHAQRTSQ